VPEICNITHWNLLEGTVCTDKKENEIFLKYKKTQMGSVAKLYIFRRKGPLIYEEIRKYLTIYED
jgi:hypothetical protein